MSVLVHGGRSESAQCFKRQNRFLILDHHHPTTFRFDNTGLVDVTTDQGSLKMYPILLSERYGGSMVVVGRSRN